MEEASVLEAVKGNALKNRINRYREIDSHFKKRYLRSRHIALAYGKIMNRKLDDPNCISRPDLCVCELSTDVITLGIRNNSDVLTVIYTNSRVFLSESARLSAKKTREVVGKKGVEYCERKIEAEKSLKFTGFIAYWRERAFEIEDAAAAKAEQENMYSYKPTEAPPRVAKSRKPLTHAAASTASNDDHHHLPCKKGLVKDIGRLQRRVASASSTIKSISSHIRNGFR